MLKGKVLIVAAVVAAVVGIFGMSTATGYLTGIKDSIRGFASKHTSTKMDVSRIEALIKKEAGKVNDFYGKITDLSDKIRGEQEKIVRVSAELKEQKHGLTIARGLITQRKEVYFVGLRNRTLMEIEHDASARVKYVKTLEAQLVLSNTLIDTLTKTERNCRATLAEANKNILAKEVLLKEMQAREINAEIQAQANALSQSLVGISDSILNHSELKEAMDIYAKKISRLERGSGQVDQSNSPWIDYSEPKELLNLLHRIDEVLVQPLVAAG